MSSFRTVLLSSALTLFVPSCVHADGATRAEHPQAAAPAGAVGDSAARAERATPKLIQPAELAAAMADYQIIDARPSASFAAGHLPGALSVDANVLRTAVAATSADSGDARAIAAALGQAGVVRERPAVIYAEVSDLAASRVLWVLEYMGHRDVRLLDGGLTAWRASGLETRAEVLPPAPHDYPASALDRDRRVDAAWVLAHLDDDAVTLVDARTPAEFAAGHIPGALSRDWTTNVASGRLKPLDALTALHAEVPRDQTVIAYCQSGARASMAYFVLRYLGYPDVRLYDGSMADWITDPSRPIER